MPKILRILNRTNIGGPVLNATLLTHFLSPEFETMLLTGYPNSDEKTASSLLDRFKVTPIYLPELKKNINLWSDYLAYKKIKKIIKEFKPDIVHTHAAKPGMLGRLAAISCDVPIILHTFHGHVFHSYFSKTKTKIYIGIERLLARKSSRIIAISQSQKKEIGERFKIAPLEKIDVVPLGLELEPYRSDQRKKRIEFRSEFNIADDTVVISIIGRLVPVKNLQLFVKSLAYLKKNTKRTFKVFIVGDGECRIEIEQQCVRLGMEISTPEVKNLLADVIFTSWRTDIDVVNAASDIIAICSLNEGTPVSIIQAQASGKAVLATNCGGILDVVVAGETALVSEQGDEIAFCKNLLLLTENDKLRNRLSAKGPQWAFSNYRHERLVSDIRTLYHNLLTKQALFKANG